MKVNVWNTIQQLSKERGVPAEAIINAIKESLIVASTKYFIHNERININFVPEKGEIRVYAVKQICNTPSDLSSEISLIDAKNIDSSSALGNSIEIDLPSDTLGRIAAQAAKQVIFQKVRDAEQEKTYNQFDSRVGELITGVLRRFESNGNMILEFDKTEVLLPEREKLAQDNYKRGDRIKAVIIHALRDSKGPQVIVSRTDRRFLVNLLKLEIPEIANGNIEIRDIVRHPGERSKAAVFSQEKDIDPIGACIGVKGNRILTISRELGGEKIDVVEWSDNPLAYAKSALSPAKIDEILLVSQRDKILRAQVKRDQFSLAIGKKGINVRLASRLIGWKIEIKNK